MIVDTSKSGRKPPSLAAPHNTCPVFPDTALLHKIATRQPPSFLL